MEETKQILEAIFKVALSQYDGLCLGMTEETPCAKNKKYLQSLISKKSSYLQAFDNVIEDGIPNEELNSVDENNCADIDNSFMNWASIIANRCKIDVDQLEGEYDNAQYVPEIVPLVLKAMKLYPCWSGIMTTTFNYGDATVSSCRVESNFNNIKNRVFNGDNLPIRVDNFVEKLISYYNGDHLLLQNSDSVVAKNNINIEDNLGSNISRDNCANNYNSHTVSSNKSFNNKCHLNNQELDTDCIDEVFNISDINNSSNQNTLQIEEDNDIELNENRKTSTAKTLNKELDTNIICLPCKNGDFPTGIHRCTFCNKSVHLFGCSVKHADNEEGYGESRICLSCFNELQEKDAEEQWQKKRKTPNQSHSRAANSYLVSQPGFDHLDLNQKGSIKSIIFLKNGNTFQNKPPCILPEIGKVILNNSCSPDSLMSILACAAADSDVYFKFLSGISKKDKTAKFIKSMLNTKTKKMMHKERILLLAPYYLSRDKQLVGGISMIDSMDTVSSTAHKLLKNMPSYKKINRCTNFTCEEFSIDQSCEIITLTAIDGKIDVQKEIDSFLKTESIICSHCNSVRNIIVSVKPNVLIELVSLPKELEASTSVPDINIISEVQQNYAGEIMWTLDEIPKTLNLNGRTYYIRGTIIFNSGLRTGLRMKSGHYKAIACRTNNFWEVYDDLKDNITQPKSIQNNVEVLIYTL